MTELSKCVVLKNELIIKKLRKYKIDRLLIKILFMEYHGNVRCSFDCQCRVTNGSLVVEKDLHTLKEYQSHFLLTFES